MFGSARRILHVVSSLERGGIELWLLQMLRAIDRDRYRMDFLVLNDHPGVFAPEVRALGSRVHLCPDPKRLWRMQRRVSKLMRDDGPYDVLHSHVHHYGGLVLRLAARAKVPMRIAHSHNDTRPAEADASWQRRLYLRLMKRWIRRCATHRIAVSRSAAEDLFGASWQTAARGCEIIPCGVDFAGFAQPPCGRAAILKELGLSADVLVLGHVGRFHARKNHRFLLEVAAAAFARDGRVRLLLVGDGELLPDIQSRASELGIADRVVFTGARGDIAGLMQAMDVFVFPSYYEGLGLVLLEAQASGLACVVAEGLPGEVDVVPGLVHRLPLTAPAATWAAVALAVRDSPRPSAHQAWQTLSRSRFTIERSIEAILRVYELGSEPGRG